MRTLLLIWLLIPFAFADDPALQNIKTKIEEKIKEIHPTDTKEWWHSLGEDAPKVIINIYENTKRMPSRMRLLHGLAWFDDPESRAFLRKEAYGTTTELIRNQIVQSVGVAAPEAEFELLKDFLKHESPRTRRFAAEAIQKFILQNPEGSQKLLAADALAQFKSNEKQRWIVDAVDRVAQNEKNKEPFKRKINLKDVLNKEFDGVWSGVLLTPQEKAPPELIELTFDWKNPDKLDVELVGKTNKWLCPDLKGERDEAKANCFQQQKKSPQSTLKLKQWTKLNVFEFDLGEHGVAFLKRKAK